MRRAKSNRAVDITPRDMEIFALLSRYRFLRSSFIHAFVGGHHNALMKRLGVLYHEGFLQRPEQQWQAINARYAPAVYELDQGAARLLQDRGLSSLRRPNRQFQHTLMVCEIVASIELAAAQSANLRLITQEQIIAKMPLETQRCDNPLAIPCRITYRALERGPEQVYEKALIPDALFGLEYTTLKAFRFFALEADRTTEPLHRSDLRQSSYLRKLLQYRSVARGAYRSFWGLPTLMVLNVTTNETHMRNTIELAQKVSGSGLPYFLFKCMGSHEALYPTAKPDPTFLTGPWLRAGHPAFVISNPDQI